MSRQTGYKLTVLFSAFIMLVTKPAGAQDVPPDEVLDIFDNSCAFAGCHAGSNAAKDLDLTEDFAFAALVNQPSTEKPDLMRVKPQDPANSYLMMKIKDAPGIEGDAMPRGRSPLSETEIATIEKWINSLPKDSKAQAPEQEYVEAFSGISLATLPTSQTIEKGLFSYRIAHRWRGGVDEGFDKLFGLDLGARMLTQLSFSLNNDIMVFLSRSSVNATFEFGGKWQFLREKTDGSVPLSAAITGGVDWATVKEIVDPENPTGGQFLSRTNSERFGWFAQLSLSKQLHERVSVLVVPGILLNGNPNLPDEDALITLGYGVKLMLFEGFSFFVEGVPILSGEDGAATVEGGRVEDGAIVINDSFTLGLERQIGGHVFHVYVTNSLGLNTGQYMSGGNFDVLDGDVRLGFNIYRLLSFPF